MTERELPCKAGRGPHRPMLRLTWVDANQVIDGRVTWSTTCLDCGAWYQTMAKVEPAGDAMN